MTNGNQLSREEQALLVEYQTLQHDNSSSMTTFWTVAGIFIGISSALFAGLIYGVLTNDRLFEVFVIMTTKAGSGREIWAIRVITSVLSLVILCIFWFLRLWMRRIGFRQQINYERMRDIERELGMWHSWRVFGVDHWGGNNFDNSIPDDDKERLLAYRPQQWWECWHTIPRYGRPNRFNYDVIFSALMFLWLFLVAGVWVPLAPYMVVAFIFAIVMTWIINHFTRSG